MSYFRLVALQSSFKMPKTRSETKTTTTTNINRLPAEVFLHIIKRLPIKNKFLLKTVCKKWHTFVISHILPEQHKLSIEKGYFTTCRCIDPDHKFKFRDNNSITVLPVKAARNRKRFFEKEVTGVKVLKLCGESDAVMKYCLSGGPSLILECLDVVYLEEPLVKVLPNLQHFSAEFINLVPLTSVLQYCPMLTHLSIDTRESLDNFMDTFMNLPKGLQYLNLEGRSCDILAVLCSPAMQTLESILLLIRSTSPIYNKPGGRFKPGTKIECAPRLQRLSVGGFIDTEEDRKMVVDLMKECPVLKKIDVAGTGLTLEDHVNIYSQLSNLEMIKITVLNVTSQLQFDEVIPIIVERNRKSLKYFQIGNLLLDPESMKKLAEFKNLQTLSFSSSLVRMLVLTYFLTMC